MAKITFGNGIANIRGSIAGNTYSANANGAYIRRKSKPTNPNTFGQQAVRSSFQFVAAGWRLLADAFQATFIGQAPNYPYRDSVGQTKQYTGFQLYMKLNSALVQNGQAPINAAQPPAGTLTPIVNNVDITAGAMVFTGALLQADGSEVNIVPDGYAVILQATQGYNTGTYRPKASDYRNIATFQPAADMTVFNVTDDYVAVFGNALGGTIIWYNMRVININTGELQSYLFATNQVVA